MLKQKTNHILPQNLLKGATIHYYGLFDESHFQTSLLLKYMIIARIEFNYLCKYMRRLEAVKQPFLYWIE